VTGLVAEVIMSGGAVARAWTTVRAHLRESAGARLFDQWLKPMELIAGSDGESVRLALPSAFMTNWVRNHYADRLLQEFRAILPDVRNVSIETRSATPVPKVLSVEPVSATVAAAPFAGKPVLRPTLDPRFTFDRFVVDQSNRVAFNAARALAEPGVPRFSPLFLHSGTGQGKTHLMHAIGAAFLDACPDANVIMMSAERFMFEFVQAVRARAQRQADQDTHAFKTRLRAADLLMIDDLQFIAGKDSTQEEFFHTMNEIISAGKRLVITSDRSPQNLEGIQDRILSRMAWGLVADINAADYELRLNILHAKVAGLKDQLGPTLTVPDDVIEFLARKITSNVRELEGALNRTIAYARLVGKPVTIEFTRETLADLLRAHEKKVTIDDIQRRVADYYHLKLTDLLSARRAREVARPRQVAMYLAKRLTPRSLPEIGRRFGGRDHTTVMHAVKRIDELRTADRELDADVAQLSRMLDG
jgi:chromosomal replication initiator protein